MVLYKLKISTEAETLPRGLVLKWVVHCGVWGTYLPNRGGVWAPTRTMAGIYGNSMPQYKLVISDHARATW